MDGSTESCPWCVQERGDDPAVLDGVTSLTCDRHLLALARRTPQGVPVGDLLSATGALR